MKQNSFLLFLKRCINDKGRPLAFCLLFLCSLWGTDAFAFAIGEFTNPDEKIKSISWNSTEQCLEFVLLVQDDWGGGANRWLDNAAVYIDGVQVFGIAGAPYNASGPSDETAFVKIDWRNFDTGNLWIAAQGATTSSTSTSRPSSWQNAHQWLPVANYSTSYYFLCSERPNQASGKLQYAYFRWYPTDLSGTNKSITLKVGSIQIREQGYSTQMESAYDVSKSVQTNVTVPTGQAISGGTIQQGGGLSFTTNGSGASSFDLKKAGTVVESKAGSPVTFTDKYIKTKAEFLTGVSFGFTVRKAYSRSSFLWNPTQTVTSQRTGVFINSLTVTSGTCGEVRLSWQLENPSTTDNVNTQAFDLQVKKGTGAWTTISQEVAYKNNTRNTTYEYTYQLPNGDLNKGSVDYEFRVKRKFVEWDDEDFGSVENDQNLFQRNKKLSINTNYKELTNIVIAPGTDNYPRLTWEFTTSGIECDNNMSLKLNIAGTETDILLSDDNSYETTFYQTKSTDGMADCTPQRYTLTLKYGTTFEKTYMVNNSYIFQPTGKREFEKITVSKGYYADHNIVQWQLKKDYDEFNRFRVLRRLLGSNDSTFVILNDVVHARGQLLYNYYDYNLNSGMYYEYKIEGIYTCDEESGSFFSPIELGFSQPYGSLAGRITYSGSSAVKDVVVNLTTSDVLKGNRELEFSSSRFPNYVETPVNDKFFHPDGFSFQVWLKPSSVDQNGYIINSDNFSLMMIQNSGKISLQASLKNSNASVNSHDNIISAGAYSHVTVTAAPLSSTSYEVCIYIDGKQDVKQTVMLSSPLTAGASPVVIGNKQKNGQVVGQGYNGVMDDIRFWSKKLSESDISLNYDHVISGKVSGLVAYYRCDETDAINSALFDCSADGVNFNGNHAEKGSGVNRQDLALSASHLSIKGVTDADGIYEIKNVIPYTNEGTTYIVTPMLGIHSFDPNKRPLYFSPDSKTFNNIDFTDVSSFPVSLTVYYANSNYPVDSVMVSIDGMPANKDGKALMTNVEGKVTIDVPIGAHFITVSKSGHTFENEGRFPANPLEKFNFQNSLSGLEFYDQTTVRLMGRVVGGQPETDQPLGFGLSKANIGKATLRLQTANDVYRLNMTDNDSIVSDNVIGGKSSTTTFKKSVAGSVIEIETNPETGEFLAVLPPVPYQLTGVKSSGFTDTGADGDVVDFSIDKNTFNMNPLLQHTVEYTNPETGVKQTFAYNDSVKITRYNDPVIIVEDKGAVPGAFGDSIWVHKNTLTGANDTISLYSVNGNTINYALGVPVFTQEVLYYNWKITAYEEYENNDGDEPLIDQVPLVGQEINIANAMAAERLEVYKDTYMEIPGTREESNTVLILDSLGTRNYRFQVGFPNMAGNHQLATKLSLVSNGKTYSWEKNAILFGQLPSDGNNFVTAGPDYVDIVLHDPPGSNSSASIEKGSSFTYTVEHTDIKTVTESVDVTIHIGSKIETAKGLGLAIINEAYSQGDINLGTEIEEEFTDNNSRQTTITFNQTISTSGDPNYVGSMADVYIGRSTNLVYGLMNELALYPTAEKPAETIASGTIGNYSLFNQIVNAVGVEFGTMFTYTQTHLIDHQIPQWKELRNQLITPVDILPDINSIFWGNDKVKYVSLLSRDHEEFGLPGTYTKYIKQGVTGNDTIDRVAQYNTNIYNWKQRILDNEEIKVKLFDARAEHEQNSASSASDAYWNNKRNFENISYDAGVQVEKSIEVSYESMEINQVLVTAGGYGGAASGLTFDGVGIEGSAKVNANRQTGTGETETENNTMKFSYTLSEDESVLFAGKDALSVDVYGPITEDVSTLLKGGTIHNLHGYIFRTRAGQTSCPFEPADSTLYYTDEEGKTKLLNYATFRIEYPELMINGQRDTASVENISAGREATFMLQMSNLSEAGMDVTYQIYPDNATNPDGLILSLDGEPLMQARQIRIPYGQTLTKTLKVRQSALDILDYSGVGIKLGSVCDIDNFSEAFLKVSFTQASSPIMLRSTSRLANRELLSNAGKITFTVSDYDRTFRNFGLIRLQYRNASSENWMTLKEYVNDPDLYPVTGDRELIGTRGSISYDFTFNEITPADGQYVFRALAVSKIGNEEVTTASEEIPVVKDVHAPRILGNPQPSNGILVAGGEISLTFNEDIQAGKITDDKFTITSILNADLRSEPTVGLSFDGAGSYAQTEQPIYTNGSFSIETWVKRPQAKAGTLFAYGESDNCISLGFDATNHVVVKIGDESYSSTETVSVDEVWKYIGLSYDREYKTVSVYALEGSSNLNLINSQSFAKEPSTQGELTIGNNAMGDSGFTGAIALTEFYNIARTIIDASASKNVVKAGNEPYLIGLWEMEEGEGNVAIDKARSRNLVLSASWYIYPSGHSLAFNGISDYAALPSGTFPFISIDDFTWELWFKAPSQGVATLLSVGSMATIDFNEAHELVLNSDEKTQVLNSKNLLDDQWHHLALSVKRNGQAKAIVDGIVTATFTSKEILPGSVGGGYYYLGAKMTPAGESNPENSYSQYFKGNIDEVRVWNLALATENIVYNKNNKLNGNEIGLVAYYPFESYQKRDQLIEVYESLNDAVAESSNSVSNMTKTSSVAVPVKDARQVKNVPFTFTASERKIVLNLTEEAYRIENVTLTITAKDILDMNNNVSAPVSWLAYVNQNSLLWDADPVNVVMQQGEKKTFSARITNSGASMESYFIENLPSWLTVSSSTGNLHPLSSKDLIFTITNGINIGNYETAIELSSGNGISKLLPVQVKVTGERPDWTVNPNDFSLFMSVYGNIQIEGVPQEDEDDILGVFIGDLCVGVASPIYVKSHNAYSVFMSVYGNSEHESQPLEFRLWDASTGRIYPEILASQSGSAVSITFEPGETKYVKTNSPVVFNALNRVEQRIPMLAGWNWFSVNVENANPDLLTQFKEGINANANEIKSHNAYLQTVVSGNNISWLGELTGISAKETYLTSLKQAQILKMKGGPVNVSQTDINLNPGWNWIGYTPQFTTTVSNALAGIDAKDGDQIKSQNEFSIYDVNAGWFGTLNYMQPGKGYMYYSENNQSVTFRYPNVNSTLRSDIGLENTNEVTHWNIDYHRFANNMTVTSIALLDDVVLEGELIEIGAFVGDDCRGSALLSYQDLDMLTHKYIGFLMVYGESGDQITFRMYEHSTGKEYKSSNVAIGFKANSMYGNAATPYELKFTSGQTSLDEVHASSISIYPNPVTTILNIRHNWDQIDRLEVVDVSGRTIMLQDNFIDESLNVSDLANGTYMLKLTNNEQTIVRKFNKK